jgi:hypothetical protein
MSSYSDKGDRIIRSFIRLITHQIAIGSQLIVYINTEVFKLKLRDIVS